MKQLKLKLEKKAEIILYDFLLVAYPVIKKVEKALTIEEKSIELNEVVKTEREHYVITVQDGEERLTTYPGFWKCLREVYEDEGYTVYIHDERQANEKKGFPPPDLTKITGTRFSQKELLSAGLSANRSGLIGAPTRWGKSHCAGTKVLMYDYTVKKVEDVEVGDELMGPDGKPRKVIALGSGEEQAYRVIPNKGEPFTCNESHILSLKITGGAKMGGWNKGDIVNIRVKDYLTRSKTFKHLAKLWYASLEFKEKELPFSPWMVGVWLGDGCSSGYPRITKPDKDVQAGIIQWAESLGLQWRYYSSGSKNDTIVITTGSHSRMIKNPLKELAKYCTNGCKYIPQIYLTASRQQRLELLAGLIDTDGYNNNNLGYEIATKYEKLSEGIMQLCRGLGMRCTRKLVQKGIKSSGFKGWYWRMHIHGDLTSIPCRGHKKITSMKNRVDPTMTGFTLEDIGVQRYYGIEIEGEDKLYLLWDHLVTHNTSLIANTIRAYPTCKTCLVAPGVDLVKQLHADMTEGKFKLEGRRVSIVCTGRTKIPTPILPGDVVVCSVDSLNKLDPTEYDLLLADEPHELVTEERLRKMNAFTKARRLGFGATLTGRFDGRDKLIEGLFGPVIVERTYREAVAEGAICPLEVIFLNVKIDPRHFFNRQRAYDSLFFRNPHVAELIAKMCHEVIPPDFQTLIFIRNEKQAEYLLDFIGTETCIAMAKRLTTKEREEVTEKLKGDKIKRCLCSKIYAKGMTFSDVRVLINAEAGGNNTSSIQKPGRLAEIRPGKKCGIILDFFFTTDPVFSTGGYAPWRALVIDSYARKKAYEDKGYEIAHVKTIEELKEKFEKLI